MNKRIKKQWIKALRSGEYQQGRGCLHNTKGQMCCLGVLLDVMVDDWWVPDPVLPEARMILSKKKWTGSSSNIDYQEQKMVGLRHIDTDTLVQMNDLQHKTFSEIADWVETNL